MSKLTRSDLEKKSDDVEKQMFPFFLFGRVTRRHHAQSTGSIGTRTAVVTGELGTVNGHGHAFDFEVGKSGKLAGETTMDDEHTHQIFGDLRNPQVQATEDAKGVLHSHPMAFNVNRPQIAPEQL
jgi:hypothetical protein